MGTYCIAQGAQLCDDLGVEDAGVGRDSPEGGDICIHIADTFPCTAETNTTL